jgi:hypothetical protein
MVSSSFCVQKNLSKKTKRPEIEGQQEFSEKVTNNTHVGRQKSFLAKMVSSNEPTSHLTVSSKNIFNLFYILHVTCSETYLYKSYVNYINAQLDEELSKN